VLLIGLLPELDLIEMLWRKIKDEESLRRSDR
jgi:hypothetical protein